MNPRAARQASLLLDRDLWTRCLAASVRVLTGCGVDLREVMG